MSNDKEQFNAFLSDIIRHSDPETQHPNSAKLWEFIRDIGVMRMNVKNMGYEIASKLYDERRASMKPVPNPINIGLLSKLSTQEDIESDWAKHWADELKIMPVYHRKFWEYVFIVQAIFEAGLLKQGATGVGFGCGEEAYPSYFASKGIKILATDLDPVLVQGKGWTNTGQHTSDLEKIWKQHLVTRDVFYENVSLKYVDMNNIPDNINGHDFCWSMCALEHLGSIRQGLDFIKNSLNVLRPGGYAIHTTEFNMDDNIRTIDNWPTVLFQKKHMEQLKIELEAQGHSVIGIDYSIGDGVLDKYIDIAPYSVELEGIRGDHISGKSSPAHIKCSIDGYPCTCIGLIIKKTG